MFFFVIFLAVAQNNKHEVARILRVVLLFKYLFTFLFLLNLEPCWHFWQDVYIVIPLITVFFSPSRCWDVFCLFFPPKKKRADFRYSFLKHHFFGVSLWPCLGCGALISPRSLAKLASVLAGCSALKKTRQESEGRQCLDLDQLAKQCLRISQQYHRTKEVYFKNTVDAVLLLSLQNDLHKKYLANYLQLAQCWIWTFCIALSYSDDFAKSPRAQAIQRAVFSQCAKQRM